MPQAARGPYSSPKQVAFLIRVYERTIRSDLVNFTAHPTDEVEKRLARKITIYNFLKEAPDALEPE